MGECERLTFSGKVPQGRSPGVQQEHLLATVTTTTTPIAFLIATNRCGKSLTNTTPHHDDSTQQQE